MSKHNKDEEIMELGHDAVPGYKPVFWVVFTVSCIYLGFLFIKHL